MNKSETVVEINKAMVAFRKEVKQPLKDKNNPFYKSKYVPLENVVEAIDKAATPLGLSYTQWALNDVDGRVESLQCLCMKVVNISSTILYL